MGVDGALVADIGAFTLIRKAVPALPLHVSTQANVMNLAGALHWAELGARRIVLARELSLERIRRIREGLPADVELEAFAHGAMSLAQLCSEVKNNGTGKRLRFRNGKIQ